MMKRIACLLLLAWPATAALANDTGYFGLLRARDLTPFGYLRLDMRPAHAVSSEPGSWGIETELAYQNTWALSPEVERYLTGLTGRRELGPADAQAIRDLPGENYLLDLELAQLDVTFHYKLAPHWGTYLVLSGVSYGGGFLDSGIESFHETFGFSTFGRPAVARNDVNAIFDLKSGTTTAFEAPTEGGLLDPTVGIRYSGVRCSPPVARMWASRPRCSALGIITHSIWTQRRCISTAAASRHPSTRKWSRRSSPGRALAAHFRGHREPAEPQQHAGRRLPARLGVQPRARAAVMVPRAGLEPARAFRLSGF